MSTQTQTLPEQMTETDWDEGLVHVFCDCDENVSMCGAPLTGPIIDHPTDDDCPLCVLIEDDPCPRCGL
ncbi:hypothetical protein [Actinophytocola sp. NPDC049390]|uniref:hypothetical protein n=1 Tax=Actinophytocola sp. NPDC049390 TaxID=3363894 RepID=UPI0037AE51B7